MTTENILDGSRVLRACGFSGQDGEKKKIREDILHFLRQRPAEAIKEFRIKLGAAAKALRNLPLAKYKEPSGFEAAWKLANVPPPLTDWDFLSHTDPEKTGILCGKPDEQPMLLTEEDLDALEDMKYEEDLGTLDLWRSLARWRKAIYCIWAARIVHGMMLMKRKTGLFLPTETPTGFPEEKNIEDGEPLGVILNLPGISDKEATDFHELCEAALFDSKTREYGAAEGFKQWLRSANIATIRECGLKFEAAHILMMAAGQRSPQIDVELRWSQEIRSYQFVCIVRNRDAHGYADRGKTAGVPAGIVMRFFENSAPQIREDMLRLVFRAGHSKARDLLLPGLDRSLD